MKIAVIDNGVNEKLLKKPLETKIYVSPDGEIFPDDRDLSNRSFEHGTICAMILEKYFPSCRICSIKILNQNGMGTIEGFGPALDWCIKNQIFLVNLSFGTTHFKEYGKLRNLVNHYTNLGMVIVAAASNSGYRSYPAAFTNVIGVATESFRNQRDALNLHAGVDLFAGSVHEIDGISVTGTQESNSYAAPYVTALIADRLSEGKNWIADLKKIPEKRDENMPEPCCYYEPDWIERAWIKTEQEKSNSAEYYFETVKGELKDIKERIDTIITDDFSLLHKAEEYDKNIIYLGNEPLNWKNGAQFFWSPELKLDQILNCCGTGIELDIPVIICSLDAIDNEMFILTEIKKYFREDGFNLFTVSLRPESILYELEYIPEEVFKKKNARKLKDFIYEQTFCKQCDGILLGVRQGSLSEAVTVFDEIEMRLEFMKCRIGYDVYILKSGQIISEIKIQKENRGELRTVYQDIVQVLTEDCDE